MNTPLLLRINGEALAHSLAQQSPERLRKNLRRATTMLAQCHTLIGMLRDEDGAGSYATLLSLDTLYQFVAEMQAGDVGHDAGNDVADVRPLALLSVEHGGGRQSVIEPSRFRTSL